MGAYQCALLCAQIQVVATTSLESMVFSADKVLQVQHGNVVAMIGFVPIDSLNDVDYVDYHGNNCKATQVVLVDKCQEAVEAVVSSEQSSQIKEACGVVGGCVMAMFGAKVKEFGETKKVLCNPCARVASHVFAVALQHCWLPHLHWC